MPCFWGSPYKENIVPKHNPESVVNVALSHAEIYELLEATRGLSKDNPTLFGAQLKLRRSVRAPKPTAPSQVAVH